MDDLSTIISTYLLILFMIMPHNMEIFKMSSKIVNMNGFVELHSSVNEVLYIGPPDSSSKVADMNCSRILKKFDFHFF